MDKQAKWISKRMGNARSKRLGSNRNFDKFTYPQIRN